MIPLASDLLPFPGQMRREGLLEFASRQTGFSSSGRIVIVGPIHRKCPAVVVVAVDKIAGRCKQATESLSSDRSREYAEVIEGLSSLTQPRSSLSERSYVAFLSASDSAFRARYRGSS